MVSKRSSPPADPPSASLVWQNAQGESFEVMLSDINTIGRGLECEISIPDPQLSRRHAEIRAVEGRYSVTDLGSVNGTCLNGNLIYEPTLLKHGDRLETGPVQFQFLLSQPAAATVAVKPPKKSTLVMPEPSRLPRLEVRSGPQQGVVFELTKDITRIGRGGRGQDWDVELQDRAVSRPQAQIVRQEDALILEDMQSVNGTLLNGLEISDPCKLKDGDILTLGETRLVFWTGQV